LLVALAAVEDLMVTAVAAGAELAAMFIPHRYQLLLERTQSQ
jgi:hypothetical protein